MASNTEWASAQLQKAVYELIEREIFDDPLVEAKPIWALPDSLIIGKARPRGSPHDFVWFICGDAPLLSVEGSAAHSARDAAKHFAYQWQLQIDPNSKDAETLIKKAESLYELTQVDELWS